MSRTLLVCFSLLCLTGMARAADHLLYFEAQGIFGYSSATHKAIAYSQNPDAEMQKPSVGFDYIKRFSGESGDFLTLAIQSRMAMVVNGESEDAKVRLEPQLYKTPI